MCDHENREAAMVTVARNARGVPTVWCDPCLEQLIRLLNDGGLATVASCCGHGSRPGWVALADGRSLAVLPDLPAFRLWAEGYGCAAVAHDGRLWPEVDAS